ncbi:MAG: tetratricopeptide repeat protein [Candidatus Kariarchaeaceae archaeon]
MVKRINQIYERIASSLPEDYKYEMTYFFYSRKVQENGETLITPNSLLGCPQLESNEIFKSFYPNGLTLAQAADFMEYKEGSNSAYVIAEGYEGLIFYDPPTRELFVDKCQLEYYLETPSSDNQNSLDNQLKRINQLVASNEDDLLNYYTSFMQTLELSEKLREELHNIKGSHIKDSLLHQSSELVYFFHNGPVIGKASNDVVITKKSIVHSPQIRDDFPSGLSVQEAVNYIELKEGIQSIYLVGQEFEGKVYYNQESEELLVDNSQLDLLVDPTEYGEFSYLSSPLHDQTFKQVLRIFDIYENRNLSLPYLDVLLSTELTFHLRFNLWCTKANMMRLDGKFIGSAMEFKKIEDWLTNQTSDELLEVGKFRYERRVNKPYVEKTIIDWDLGAFYYYMGYSLYLNAKFSDALDYFSMSVMKRREQGTVDDLIRTLIFLGLTYKNKRDFELAEKFLLESIDLSSEITDYSIKALAIRNIVDVYIFNNDLESALTYVEIAHSINQQVDDPYISARTFEMMARVYIFLGDLVKSKDYYIQSMNYHEKTNNEPRLINSYFELFSLTIQFQEINEAKLFLDKLLKLANKGQTYRNTALQAYHLLSAKLYLSQQEHDRAKQSLYDVINQGVIQPEHKIYSVLTLLHCLIEQYRLNKDHNYIEEIKVLLPRIQKISSELNVKSILGITNWVQYKICLIEQNFDKAIEFKKQAKLTSEISYISKMDTYWMKDLQFDLDLEKIDQSEILDEIEKVIVNELIIKYYTLEI